MKVEISGVLAVDRDSNGFWLWEAGRPVLYMTFHEAERLADTIMAEAVGAYNYHDEDGSQVADEVVMKGLE